MANDTPIRKRFPIVPTAPYRPNDPYPFQSHRRRRFFAAFAALDTVSWQPKSGPSPRVRPSPQAAKKFANVRLADRNPAWARVFYVVEQRPLSNKGPIARPPAHNARRTSPPAALAGQIHPGAHDRKSAPAATASNGRALEMKDK